MKKKSGFLVQGFTPLASCKFSEHGAGTAWLSRALCQATKNRGLIGRAK